jgi:hypothetical protein
MWLIIDLQAKRKRIDASIDALTLEWQGIKANEFVQKQAEKEPEKLASDEEKV